MAKQPEFTKYLPLDGWFRTQPASKRQLTVTFEQVEKILGAPLPASSVKPSWWTNVYPKIQSHRTCWLNHGWLVDEYDPASKAVKFIRTK
ncbi:MAG: hypothetical protein B0W54_04965 [Cellvibrio sp. 79]|nr:MAG: hypothetical protein B0W54_04965 [Cellvibrio sp. 79]